MNCTTILRGVVGSTAYGLNHADSDIDRLGCFVAPTASFMGLHIPTAQSSSRVQTEPSDSTEHEIGKFLRLLLGCNPTVSELLWLPNDLYEIKTSYGNELIAMRSKLVFAKGVRNAYLGYATQQFKRLSERGDGSFSADTRKRTAKHARHLKRLCWQGHQLYATGTLPIRVENPDEYMKFGEFVTEDASIAGELIAEYEELFDSTPTVLPERPDEEAADEWLVHLRRQFYDG